MTLLHCLSKMWLSHCTIKARKIAQFECRLDCAAARICKLRGHLPVILLDVLVSISWWLMHHQKEGHQNISSLSPRCLQGLHCTQYVYVYIQIWHCSRSTWLYGEAHELKFLKTSSHMWPLSTRGCSGGSIPGVGSHLCLSLEIGGGVCAHLRVQLLVECRELRGWLDCSTQNLLLTNHSQDQQCRILTHCQHTYLSG